MLHETWVGIPATQSLRQEVDMPDRDVIMTNVRRGRGALLAGIVAAALILLSIWYFGVRGTNDIDVDDVPETVDADS
jgi:hypothetical protein